MKNKFWGFGVVMKVEEEMRESGPAEVVDRHPLVVEELWQSHQHYQPLQRPMGGG
ncbi:hypothetical protein Leryth_026044 [Lithospermum erythrorhizon]|nr:hypothetical protein Leryth_026044 [Lithospermum erythrorhizon]